MERHREFLLGLTSSGPFENGASDSGEGVEGLRSVHNEFQPFAGLWKGYERAMEQAIGKQL